NDTPPRCEPIVPGQMAGSDPAMTMFRSLTPHLCNAQTDRPHDKANSMRPVIAGLDPAICSRNDTPPRCEPIVPGQMAGSGPAMTMFRSLTPHLCNAQTDRPHDKANSMRPVIAGLDPAICSRNDTPPRCEPIVPGQMAGSGPAMTMFRSLPRHLCNPQTDRPHDKANSMRPVIAGLDPAICSRNDTPPRCEPIVPGQMAGSGPAMTMFRSLTPHLCNAQTDRPHDKANSIRPIFATIGNDRPSDATERAQGGPLHVGKATHPDRGR